MTDEHGKPNVIVVYGSLIVSLLMMFLVIFGSCFYILSSPDNFTHSLIYFGCQSLLFVGCVCHIAMCLKKYIDYKFEELKKRVERIEDIRIN